MERLFIEIAQSDHVTSYQPNTATLRALEDRGLITDPYGYKLVLVAHQVTLTEEGRDYYDEMIFPDWYWEENALWETDS